MDFVNDVKAGFSRMIEEHGLVVAPESDRTVRLVRKDKYLLFVSLSNHFEIDFLFYGLSEDGVVAFNPMHFIGMSRQDKIPRDQLISPSVSWVEKLSNYQSIFMMAGSDFFSGSEVWNHSDGPSLTDVTDSSKEVTALLISSPEIGFT